MDEQLRIIKDHAIKLLARREHSQQELSQKLIAKSYAEHLVSEVLDQLAREGLQSDQRYAEAWVRYRYGAGHGPTKIMHELQHKGIAKDMACVAIEQIAPQQWLDAAARQLQKKLTGSSLHDYQAKMKVKRFLLGRGFSYQQVDSVMDAGYMDAG